ncbi:hypothetical protein VSS37_03935 [Candidatus Thiothrix sp. Deng01]|uniref:Uncharacterized protein n=1 Tax=Candidatus Thiothrix phosphatis TaxID=3112415 RepID=A0ABU6CVL4_9GAMM|nr:hypothetical protein [Candidatus Thiothrix sp. Deng01]MEB4590122.1 hypothetical protein [Candidatus Thiothrix sp. Deng01]
MTTTNDTQAFRLNNDLHRQDVEARKQARLLEHSEGNLGKARIVTFLLYFAAVWTLYVFDIWGAAGFIASQLGELPAFLLFGTISLVLPAFLSSTKEDLYRSIAEHFADGKRLT